MSWSRPPLDLEPVRVLSAGRSERSLTAGDDEFLVDPARHAEAVCAGEPLAAAVDDAAGRDAARPAAAGLR